ncbi:MAG: PEP-CTERM sorting domain-containing protein [Phycisphaerae bacterium]
MRHNSVFVSVAGLLGLFIGGATSHGSAIPVPVPVANPSFEEQVLASGSLFFSPTPITGWTATASGGSDRGLWHFVPIGQDGFNVAFVNSLDSLAQDLGHAIVPNATYTVEFLFGSNGTSSSGVVEFYAGGTVSNGVVTGGTFLDRVEVDRPFTNPYMVEHTLAWTSPLSGLPVGENLSIRLAYGSTGISVAMFDDIRISYVLVPEPVSGLILPAGGMLLANRRRRQI